MPRHVELVVTTSQTAAEITRTAVELFVQSTTAAVQARGQARVAISGGTTPRAVFEMLANPAEPYLTRVPWPQMQLFWVDERCVPPTHDESNFGMTKTAMLSCVPLPLGNVHRMEGELEPQEAASRYESEIRNSFKLEGAETPTFDLILLGLGPDGHTASLFPHTEGLHEMARICMANHVPQKDVWRLSLTWPVIVQGRKVVFLIEGTDKAEMVRTVFTGRYDPETYPAQLIRPASGSLTLLLDAAAAAQLPGAESCGTTRLELS